MPTLSQIRTIQTGRSVVGLTDPAYRTLLRSVAGVESSKDLDNAGVEDVLAVLEGMGFDSHPAGKTYWRDKVDARGRRANARQVHLIRQLAPAQRYDLAALVERQSGGRTRDVEQLLPREAWMLTEMLKATGKRETQGAAGQRRPAAARQDAAGREDRHPGQGGPSLFDLRRTS
jgi:hypothetical protein